MKDKLRLKSFHVLQTWYVYFKLHPKMSLVTSFYSTCALWFYLIQHGQWCFDCNASTGQFSTHAHHTHLRFYFISFSFFFLELQLLSLIEHWIFMPVQDFILCLKLRLCSRVTNFMCFMFVFAVRIPTTHATACKDFGRFAFSKQYRGQSLS